MHLEFWTAPRDSFLFCLSSRPFFISHYPIAQLIPALRCFCFLLCTTAMYVMFAFFSPNN